MKTPKHKSPKLDMKRIGAFVKYYKHLQKSQKTGMIIGALVILVLPIAVVATQTQVRNNSKAYNYSTTNCKPYWVTNGSTACKLLNYCSTEPLTITAFRTESECLTSLGVKCQKLWWFDAQSKNCQQKNFCGTYMYRGLKTFTSEAACTKAFKTR